MIDTGHSCDICIICALAEEARAVLEVISRRCHVSFEKGSSLGDHYEYRSTTIQNKKGEALSLAVSWLPDKGPLETGLYLKPLLREFRPHFVAMSGICAGDKRKVKLGDLVIADRAFLYDTGKIMTDKEGRPEHLHDVTTYTADPNIIQVVRLFDAWKPIGAKMKRPPSIRQQREWLLNQLLAVGQVEKIPIKELEHQAPDWRRLVQELQEGPDPFLTSDRRLRRTAAIKQMRYGTDVFPFKDPSRPACHIAPMASGSAVRGDNPFQDVQVPVRGTVAIDMEGAAFYRTLREFPGIRSLLVKGVCDYADKQKDDSYHRYAAAISAIYVLCFIQEYVTTEWISETRDYQRQGRRDPPFVWHVPYRRNPFFTGREELLKRLHGKLATTRAAALTQAQAVSGLGGIGKTQVALEYAYRYRDEFRFVMWVRAASRETLIADFVTLAEVLQLPEKEEQDQNKAVAAVKHWLATRDDWLLIFDNADDVALLHDFLPTEGKGSTLFTTRAQAVGTIAQSVEVENMGMVEAALLLLRRAKLLREDAFLDQASEEDLAGAEALAIALDFLPLALDQAGAYIEETGCSLAGYFDLYSKQRESLLSRRGALALDHPEPVTTTWSLSFQKIEQSNPAATEVLRVCAFLDPDAIPEELISSGASSLGPVLKRIAADPLKLNEAIEELRKFSLVRCHPELKTLSIHRLVQAVLKDEMKRRTQRQWAERVVRAVSRVFPAGIDVATRSQCNRFLSQAQACAVLIEHYTLTCAEALLLLSRTAGYLQGHALYTQAEPLLRRALTFCEQELGPNHSTMASLLNNLAALLADQGKYADAESLLQRALSIREQQLGPDHPDTAMSLNNLAALYKAQGKYANMEPLLQRALHIREQQLGSDHLDTAISLNNLATLYKVQSKYADAESLLQRALTIYEGQLGPDHPTTASTLCNLAALSADLSRYAEAESLLQRALTIQERQLGPDHPDTAQSLSDLAIVYVLQGNHAQAEPLLQRALVICEQQLGSDHPTTAQNLSDLASVYYFQGRYAKAEPLYQRALLICEQRWGRLHPSMIPSLKNYARLLRNMEREAEARSLEAHILD